jgi:ParB family chromosome partitioning protein
MLIGQPNAERLAEEVVARGLNVRQVESIAREAAEKGGKARGARALRRGAGKNANLIALEKRVSDALGLAVSIDERKRGGALIIRYRSLEQLDEVLRRLEKR